MVELQALIKGDGRTSASRSAQMSDGRLREKFQSLEVRLEAAHVFLDG